MDVNVYFRKREINKKCILTTLLGWNMHAKLKILSFLISTAVYPLLYYVIAQRIGSYAGYGGMETAEDYPFTFYCILFLSFATWFILSTAAAQWLLRGGWIGFLALAAGILILQGTVVGKDKRASRDPQPYTEYDSNGNVQEQGNKVVGWKHGKVTTYDENGHIKQVLKIGDGEEYALNPLYNASLGTKFETTYQNFIDNFSVEWDVLEGLKLKAAVSLNKKMTVEDRFLPAGHNSFYEKDLKGSYEKKVTDDFSYDANVMAAYTKEVNRHLFNATFVWNIKETKNDLFTTTAYNFPNDKMDHIGMGVEYQDGDKPSGDYEVSRLMGVVGNFNYGYDNRYLVDFSVRSDGSSVYGSSKRWGTFGSVGVAWNLHHEKWLAENPYVNELKIRGSWGTTGGQNFYPFQAMMMYSYKESAIDGLTYDDYIGALLKAFGNPDLKWQQTEKLNVGVDFTLLNSRLSGYFNIYKDVSKSVLIDVLLAPSVGFASYKDNLGEIENKGLELNLRGVLLKDADRRMQWDVFFNIVKNKNRLMKLNDALAAYNKSQDDEMNGEIEEGKTRAPMVRYQEGKSINMIWANESIGIDPNTGEEVFIALNGDKVNKWSTDNYKPLGCSDPKFEGNFGTMFMYKGFQLNAYFRYSYGADVYNQTLVDKVENVDPKENADRRVLYDRWKTPGDVAKFKAISNTEATMPTSRFIEQENYITLSSLNLSYQFDAGRLRHYGIERLKLSLIGNDVFRASTVKMERGTSYPFARNYSVALQVTF